MKPLRRLDVCGGKVIGMISSGGLFERKAKSRGATPTMVSCVRLTLMLLPNTLASLPNLSRQYS